MSVLVKPGSAGALHSGVKHGAANQQIACSRVGACKDEACEAAYL